MAIKTKGHELEHEAVINHKSRNYMFYKIYKPIGIDLKNSVKPKNVFRGFNFNRNDGDMKKPRERLSSIMAFGRKHFRSITDYWSGKNLFEENYVVNLVRGYQNATPFTPHLADITLDIGKPPIKIMIAITFRREGIVGRFITDPVKTKEWLTMMKYPKIKDIIIP